MLHAITPTAVFITVYVPQAKLRKLMKSGQEDSKKPFIFIFQGSKYPIRTKQSLQMMLFSVLQILPNDAWVAWV